MKQARNLLVTMSGLIALIVVAEQLGPLKHLHAFTTRNERLLLSITIPMGVVGFVLLMGTIVVAIIRQRRLVDDEQGDELSKSVQDAKAAPFEPWAWTSRFKGWSMGGGYSEEHSFGEVKDALRSGKVWGDPLWSRFLLAVAGGLLLTYGMFLSLFVIGPPVVKLMMAGALVYATVRMSYAFWHA